MNLAEIRNRLNQLRNQNYVRSLRRGPTGIGYTLERMLGLTESNISLPDFGSVELKSFRSGSQRYLTLFTLNRLVWQPSAREVIERFGYFDENRDRLALYSSVKNTPNAQNLLLDITNNEVRLISINNDILGIWNIISIQDKIMEKLQSILIIRADSLIINGVEHFWYNDAKIHSACSIGNFFDLLKNGNIFIDIRMHMRSDGSVRNHGTGFRIPSNHLETLYINHINLME